MVTWQDLVEVGEDEHDRMNFIRATVNDYKSGDMYKLACIADEYDRKQNPDIRDFTKMIYTVTGNRVEDTISSNYKIGRAFFPIFITQENQYLLSNGINWTEEKTADSLGTAKYPFDTQLQKAGYFALCHGCSFGFWNLDHVDVFSALEFAPLYDEENGALRAGIRFWQVDSSRPFRATLYEEDGYTNYIWRTRQDKDGKKEEYGEVLKEKKPYIIHTVSTEVDEEKLYTGENYPSFPIVPLFGNKRHQSELVGLREQIFAYDMIRSGFCNTVEESSFVFWAVHNAAGMDDEDLVDFMQRVRQLHIAITEDSSSSAVPQQIETPYQSREALLGRLEKDIYKDAMAFDPEYIAGGAVTATQIRAAYENLDMKANDYEYCVLEFVTSIMELAGVEDEPSFTRSKNVNVAEEISTVIASAEFVGRDYCTRKILDILGDGDKADQILSEMAANELGMLIQEGMENGAVNNGSSTPGNE